MFSKLAEYIKYVVVEFSDSDNYTKHAMTALDCNIGRSIDMDSMHYMSDNIEKVHILHFTYTTSNSQLQTNIITSIITFSILI